MEVVGQAVLKDYPLRLWAEQQEHFDDLLREFKLLLISEERDPGATAVPRELVEIADMFTTRYGSAIDAINAERYEAVEQGRDRMDSVVPLVPETPVLMDRLQQVLAAVDEFCRQGSLLTLARPPHLVQLSNWTSGELKAQHAGGQPTPWPGPF